jgi:hypothetical protein
VIYTGYAFNVIKKEENLEGIHGGEEEEGRELTRSGRLGRQRHDEVVDVVSSSRFGDVLRQDREMVAGISTSGRPPPALPLCLQSSFLPAVVTDNHHRAAPGCLAGGQLAQPVELDCWGGHHQERSHGRRPADILIRGVVDQKEGRPLQNGGGGGQWRTQEKIEGGHTANIIIFALAHT